MDSEVHQASAAGQLRVPEPAALRTISVVEDEVGGEDSPELTVASPLADCLHGRHVAIRQIDPEQTIGTLCGVEHHLDLRGIPPKRLLAKYGQSALERPIALLRVERAGCGDDDSV